MEAFQIREQILSASQDLFRKYGYHKASMNEIAKKARLAKATIYKYFESKDDILKTIILNYLSASINELISGFINETANDEKLKQLILKTSRLSYTVCNEFIGWDFIRESTNAQQFLKELSNELESILVESFKKVKGIINNDQDIANVRFLVKTSKSIVFSFAFTSVSDSDVRKNFVIFEKEILPFLLKAVS